MPTPRAVTALGIALVLAPAACATLRPATQAAAPAPAPAAPVPSASAPAEGTPGERAVEAHFAPTVAACERGEAAACARLAQRQHFATNEREHSRLVAALTKGCAAHSSTACAGQGFALVRGMGVAADVPRGVALLETACKAGDGFGCGELAEIEIEGQLVTGKQTEGKRLATEACEKHGGWPCASAKAGLDPQKDTARVVALVQRACDGGDAMSCYELGMAYADGEPGLITQDAARATRLYEQGCAGDFAQACFNLAWQFLRGTGAPHDERHGRELLERSCLIGDASGCDELARRDGDLSKYCDLWGAQACFDLAGEISKKRGETAEAAAEILRAGGLACARGSAGACRVLSHLRKDSTRWCESGERVRDTCTIAGLFYANIAGDATAPADERESAKAKATVTLDRACTSGATPACEARRKLAP